MNTNTAEAEQAQFSLRNAGTTELRGECPRHIVDVLDAVTMARGPKASRTELVNEILGEWAAKELHRATLIHRVVGLNPAATETSRSAP